MFPPRQPGHLLHGAPAPGGGRGVGEGVCLLGTPIRPGAVIEPRGTPGHQGQPSQTMANPQQTIPKPMQTPLIPSNQHLDPGGLVSPGGHPLGLPPLTPHRAAGAVPGWCQGCWWCRLGSTSRKEGVRGGPGMKVWFVNHSQGLLTISSVPTLLTAVSRDLRGSLISSRVRWPESWTGDRC